tara:strand:+ start:7518 stop:8276 length:759 start_codon:yes stop_codon:yes gene_type:complete
MEVTTEHKQGLRSMRPVPKHKRALLTGCGSKFGRVMLEVLLEKYDAIDLITSTPFENIKQSIPESDKLNIFNIDWHESMGYFMQYELPNPKDPYDLVFFNHNNKPQGFGIDSYYKDVLWTQEIVNKIQKTADTKIGWMITSGIISPPDWFEYSPYFHQKHSRLYLMYFLQYMNDCKFFAIDPGEPDALTSEEKWEQATHMANFMLKKDMEPATLYKAIYHSGKVQEPEFNWKLDWIRQKEQDYYPEDPFIYD